MPTKTKLIIVESPAKGKTIVRYLGRGYKVEASQGHVRDLPKSQLGIDTQNDFVLKYITIRGRGDILARIRKEAKNASVIYLATDPDREGEAIAWHLAGVLDLDVAAPCRVEFHEVTKKAVQAALKAPRAIDMNLVDAQQARRALDRIVGYKISPLLWAKIRKGLSAGRVQSVATRLVVLREREIDIFIPEEYWEITGYAQTGKNGAGLPVKLVTLDGRKVHITNETMAAEVRKRIETQDLVVTSIKQSEKRKSAAAPFTTSSLQQEAGRKLNFTTQKTMQVVQSLYEGVEIAGEGLQGLVTYIRTDSVRVSAEALTAVRDFIPVRYGQVYLPNVPNEYKGRKNAQDAHEAIRPTDINRTPVSVKESLSRDQFNLYKLVYFRFLASQMAPAVFDTLTVDIATVNNDIGLRFYGEHKKFAGFTYVYEEGTDEDSSDSFEMKLPELMGNGKVVVSDLECKQIFTQPPSRYTEAALVRALEEKGIGRPSTYAPTITTIIARGYVSREKKRLFPTELGKITTDLMEEYFKSIVDTDFTAELEEKLDLVEDGSLCWKDVLKDFFPPFMKTLEIAEKEIEKIEVQNPVSDIPCENCGSLLVYKKGRYGEFLACPRFPDCRFTKQIVHYVQAPCPQCGARIVEKISKKNRLFYGCEAYPGCSFVSWYKPVEAKCPQCGGYMVEKRSKKSETRHECANDSCRYRVIIEEEDAELS